MQSAAATVVTVGANAWPLLYSCKVQLIVPGAHVSCAHYTQAGSRCCASIRVTRAHLLEFRAFGAPGTQSYGRSKEQWPPTADQNVTQRNNIFLICYRTLKRLLRERTCFLVETFARVEENGADEERLDEVFVEHLADLGAGRVEDISLYLGLRGDKHVVVADLQLFRFSHSFYQHNIQSKCRRRQDPFNQASGTISRRFCGASSYDCSFHI